MHKPLKYLAFFLALLLVGCQQKNNTEAENKAIVEQYLRELVNKGDFTHAEDIVSPDFAFYLNGEKLPGNGVAFLVDMFDEWDAAISNGLLTEEEIIAEGNVVAVRWSEVGTHDKADYMGIQAQNREYKYYGMSFYRLEDGKLTEAYISADLLKLLGDLGGLPGE